jgi:hypothetical protein
MGQRLDLQTLLETLAPNVYFQPPDNMQIQYPCIVYQRYRALSEFADNNVYNRVVSYQVTVIDPDPDSLIPAKVGALPLCTTNRNFVAGNLNHDVYTLYF